MRPLSTNVPLVFLFSDAHQLVLIDDQETNAVLEYTNITSELNVKN